MTLKTKHPTLYNISYTHYTMFVALTGRQWCKIRTKLCELFWQHVKHIQEAGMGLFSSTYSIYRGHVRSPQKVWVIGCSCWCCDHPGATVQYTGWLHSAVGAQIFQWSQGFYLSLSSISCDSSGENDFPNMRSFFLWMPQLFPRRTARPIGIAFNSAFFAPIFYHRVRVSSMEMEPDDVSFFGLFGMWHVGHSLCSVGSGATYSMLYADILICWCVVLMKGGWISY